jgi:hypothetical protein
VKIKINKTIILPVVLYGCETWSLTLREERRLRVFENRVLRRIFGPKRDEVTGGWRKLHNEELHGSYSSPSESVGTGGLKTKEDHLVCSELVLQCYSVKYSEAVPLHAMETHGGRGGFAPTHT